MTTKQPKSPSPSPVVDTVAARLLKEGVYPARHAATHAGIGESVMPSSKTFLRAMVSKKLEALKIGGRWVTSPDAIVRWVDASQHRRAALMPTIGQQAADKILSAYGFEPEEVASSSQTRDEEVRNADV